jgi:hypothetical protein
VRETRQPGGVRGEVGECDRPAAHRQLDACRKVVLHGVVERQQPVLDHAGQQRGGEDLCHRADLEDRVRGRRRRPGRTRRPGSHDPGLPTAEYPDRHADMATCVTHEQLGDERLDLRRR